MVADRSEMIALFDACDVFVHPSVQESFGLVYLEAMARARPVVAVDAGPAPEWVGENERGILFRPDDRMALADAISSLLDNPARSRALGEQGRCFAGQFRWQTAAEALRGAVQEFRAR
jgi:glycosyltransferase involved in cell wall biosynthesis